MELTVDLEPEALRRAESLASERRETIGKVLGDAILGRGTDLRLGEEADIEVDEEGWPVLRFGHPLTLEEARSLVAED